MRSSTWSKRPAMTHRPWDTLDLLICVLVSAASVQDRDGDQAVDKFAQAGPANLTLSGPMSATSQTAGLACEAQSRDGLWIGQDGR